MNFSGNSKARTIGVHSPQHVHEDLIPNLSVVDHVPRLLGTLVLVQRARTLEKKEIEELIFKVENYEE